ncbi:NAD-dependent epimerase/dehydratase family protein [Undibacterium pigrum]|uniref:dTDP-6-deoxy-L-talose 4-dehydrogenase (NAD+) n=1 Tax=Undibacterium pigrum TaxID=401470 RepID=A0A318JEB3_9BURK|nr:NAD(P)-dependent oxidoreductase [Undibacterium pigrum]PXX45434.1 dTDP-6-deoxy-L-talose 4-dehydrogenase (NAD+) [Undibacterium pigrum]
MTLNEVRENNSGCRQLIVSGATGFIGQHLIPLLLAENYEVVAIARDEQKARAFDWYDKLRFISLDFHQDKLDFQPEPGASLIHLAWQGLPNYKSLFHLEENLPKNYDFIKQLVKAGVSNVLVTGTCFEYGFQYGPIAATATPMPANPYALAKDNLRQYLGYLQAEFSFRLQWARLFYMYGKGQNPKSILAQLDTAIANGDSVFNMSGGEQLRDYLPVEAVAQQLLDILKSKQAGAFNVCSGEAISIRRLVEERIKERGASIHLNLGYYPYPDYEPMAFWGINNKEIK